MNKKRVHRGLNKFIVVRKTKNLIRRIRRIIPA